MTLIRTYVSLFMGIVLVVLRPKQLGAVVGRYRERVHGELLNCEQFLGVATCYDCPVRDLAILFLHLLVIRHPQVRCWLHVDASQTIHWQVSAMKMEEKMLATARVRLT